MRVGNQSSNLSPWPHIPLTAHLIVSLQKLILSFRKTIESERNCLNFHISLLPKYCLLNSNSTLSRVPFILSTLPLNLCSWIVETTLQWIFYINSVFGNFFCRLFSGYRLSCLICSRSLEIVLFHGKFKDISWMYLREVLLLTTISCVQNWIVWIYSL